MKQKLYWIGIFSLILATVGTIFKMMHFPGAAILLTVGFAGLILIFFPLGLQSSYRKDDIKALKPLYIVGYITMLIVFTGMLFKIMHWPGAGILLFIALPLPFVVFLPFFIVITGKIEKFNIYSTVSVLMLLTFISAFNGLMAMNVAKEKLNDSMFLASLYHRTSPISAQSMQTSVETGEAVRSADYILKLIREAKDKFMIGTGSDSDMLANNPYSIRYADSNSLTADIMFNGTEPNLGYQLEKSIAEFLKSVAAAENDLVTVSAAKELLDFTEVDGGGWSWAELMFDDNWTSWSLVYLGMLEDNVLLLKSELLSNTN